MRVVGGSARGRRLKAPPTGARPTADIVREAIFDVLQTQGADFSRVLDLYAGSGALGIEALSRGGGWCDFVERGAANAGVIRANLAAVGLTEHGSVHHLAAARATDRLEGPYSLVLADPPYNDEAAIKTIDEIAQSQLVMPETIMVVEHSARRERAAQLGPLPLAWSRRYGDTQVSIYRR